MPKDREMAYPAPTKGCSKLSPDTAMLFAPFGCNHPPPPAPPFLLSQNLSPKDIARCEAESLMTPYGVIGWERANGDVNKIKTELFTDIYDDSGSHLGQTMSSVSIQPKLATVGFTGTVAILTAYNDTLQQTQ